MKTPWWRRRDYVSQYEGRLTILQVIGFWLIALGLLLFLWVSFLEGAIASEPKESSADGVACAFFMIMLGVALAFPDMLKGQTKDVSTMRIVVFMFTNVICMLMLKHGWNGGSLEDVGLDGYWVGVIGFLFGAKAAQAFMENSGNFFRTGTKKEVGDSGSEELAVLAVAQNATTLQSAHPNIEFVSDTLKNGQACVTIYLKDDAIEGLPSEVPVKLPDGRSLKVDTEIIPGGGEAEPHIGQTTDDIRGPGAPAYYGSICCLVGSSTDPAFKGVMTSGHIFTCGEFRHLGNVVGDQNRQAALISNVQNGTLFFQRMWSDQDLAIVKLDNMNGLLNDYVACSAGYFEVTMTDVSQGTEVRLLSRNGNSRKAYILDRRVSFEIGYQGSPKRMRNIILIGSTKDRSTSSTVSTPGDSGSCVLDTSDRLIGMLLGGNQRFSFVLPVKKTLEQFNFHPL